MARTLVGALALAAVPSALAFRNTSPFFLFSTADVLLPNAHGSIADASAITQDVLGALQHCPTSSYLILEQHGVSSADYVDASSAPHLSQYMRGDHEAVRSTFSIPDVYNQLDHEALSTQLQAACASKGGASVLYQRLRAPTSDRKHDLQSNDAILENAVLKEGADYTVIFITTPQTDAQAKAQPDSERHPAYQMDNAYPEAYQIELKRDLSSTAKHANSTEGGLFERYQYFTPGLFMGFAAIIPLFLIVLVGLRALLSLEVSYFAFSKEMGPNAQKKQQQ